MTPARAGSARYRKAPHGFGPRVEAPGRSLEPRSNARPRGMTVLVAPRHQTEFGLQVRLSQLHIQQRHPGGRSQGYPDAAKNFESDAVSRYGPKH